MTPAKKPRSSTAANTAQPHPVNNNHTHTHDTNAPPLNGHNPPSPDSLAAASIALARTNEDLNLSVLRRYWPDVRLVIASAPYAVVYVFAPAVQAWEKVDVEGTLFIAACDSNSTSSLYKNGNCNGSSEEETIERFRVMVLNRRGLENFSAELLAGEDVDVSGEYIIIKGGIVSPPTTSDGGEDAHDEQARQQASLSSQNIYGLWIFAEPPPSSTAHMRELLAQIILECAKRASASRIAVKERETERLAMQLEQQNPAEVLLPLLEGGDDEKDDDDNVEKEDDEATSNNIADTTPTNSVSLLSTGRQLSLKELFGRQRENDSGFTVHEHRSQHQQLASTASGSIHSIISPEQQGGEGHYHFAQPKTNSQPQLPIRNTSMFMSNPDTEFFRTGRTPVGTTTTSRGTTPLHQQQSKKQDTIPRHNGAMITVEALFKAQANRK